MTDGHTLSLAYASDGFPLVDFDVKRRVRRRLLDAECVVTVIGSSHYVAAPALGLYELFSCEPIADPDAIVPLRKGTARSVRFAAGPVVVDTRVDVQPLEAFPGPDRFDVAYRFGPDAYTTVDCLDEGYETYHTYPELDLAVYTESALERTAVAGATPNETRSIDDE